MTLGRPYLFEWLFCTCEVKGKNPSGDVSFSYNQHKQLPLDWKIGDGHLIPILKGWKEEAYAESTLLHLFRKSSVLLPVPGVCGVL